jgi:hypothetical protein
MIIETKNCLYLGYVSLTRLDQMQERVEVAAAKRKKAAERKTKEDK